MSFGLPIALQTLLTVAGAVAGLATIAYILKMRRRQFEVPFSALWHRVLRETQTTSLWRRLKRWLSLLLQLLILALLVFAAADPRLGAAPRDARSVLIVVDASASMKATDGDDGRPRMRAARAKAHELVRSLGSGDAAMIVRMDGRTTPMSRFDSDKVALHAAIDAIDPSDTPADLRSALTAAGDALRGRQRPLVVLIGDGAYHDDLLRDVVWDPIPATEGFADERLAAIDLHDIDVRFVPVGERGDNVGIVAFNVRRYVTNKLSYEVFLEVQNFGDRPAQRELVLYDGATPVEVRPLSLDAGERIRHIYPDLGGGDGSRLRALLRPAGDAGDHDDAPADAFALDDEAFALLPARTRQDVLLVTRDNLFLEGAMLVYEDVNVEKLTPATYDLELAAGNLPPYDAIVFDQYTPAAVPEGANLIYFGPEGEHSPFPVASRLSAPRITDVNEAHPVMRWVALDDVNFDASSVFRLDPARGDTWLARSIHAPVIAARREADRKVVAFGFGLQSTDLVMRVAFPLVLVNALDWLAGDDADLITTYATGHRLRVPIDAPLGITDAQVREPDGRAVRAPIADGRASFYAASVGIYQLQAGPVRVSLAANLVNPAESDIRPEPALTLGGRPLAAPEAFVATRRRAIWSYLALAVLALLALEWISYNRRVTV